MEFTNEFLKLYPYANATKQDIKKVGLNILKQYSKKFLNDKYNTILFIK